MSFSLDALEWRFRGLMSAIIDQLLRDLVGREASDLHLKVNEPPIMRIHGDLKRMDYPKFTQESLETMLRGILNEERIEKLQTFKELDLSYNVPGAARFRVNMFWQRGKIGAVFRVIPFKIKTIDELMMPQVCKRLSLLARGLILVTGPTGSGKTTSLAAMIDHINMSRRSHIMTIEDPIEYVHQDKMGVINQRELGTDTHAFAEALKHVMRQNPDVILVGEMRDLETIQLAITAAETGHLVFSTLHTVDAAQTIDRMVDVFPPDQQAQIRTQLSVTLQAVISQALLPTADGRGRVAAFEVMAATPSIRTLIRDGKTHQLYLDIQTGADMGMQTLDASLLGLVKNGHVDYEHALAKCSNAIDFQTRAQKMGLVEGANAAN
jgi:twitching motility protein PilT